VNFKISDKYLPTYLLAENLKFCLLAKVMAKFPQTKGLVHAFTAKAIGEIIKN
jgi:hypothetical protein